MTIQIAGEGGEGVISIGDLLTSVIAQTRHDVFTFRTFPAEIKGGPAMFQLRFAEHPVLSAGTRLDVLLAFNQQASDLHAYELKEDGLIIFDSSAFEPGPEVHPGVLPYGVPLTDIAAKEAGQRKSKNMVALGVLGGLLDISLDSFRPLVASKFKSKGEQVLGQNIKALELGFKWAAEHSLGDRLHVPCSEREDVKLVMSGNEALATGAIVAGCRFYAGYPITPASEILTVMERHMPKFGGVSIQTEDEIAAITSCIGASYAGTPSMTATSGPGFSLMAEALGLATMVELPLVVVDVQRGGPSTGMPTKTEQSDLNSAIYSSHGEAPRVVLAPSNVKDCFYGMVRAFYIAEKYQVPVVMLSDQSLSHRTQTFTKPKLENLPVPKRLRAKAGENFQRFADTENGVSPIPVPGDEGLAYIATGLEHTEAGNPSWLAQNHTKMNRKRHRKLDFIAKETGFIRQFGDPHATTGIVCWGSTEGPVEEAIHMATLEGLEVSAMTIKMLHPLPLDEIRGFLNQKKKVIVVELNFTGQLCQILRSQLLFPFDSYSACPGIPFSPIEILDQIRGWVRHG